MAVHIIPGSLQGRTWGSPGGNSAGSVGSVGIPSFSNSGMKMLAAALMKASEENKKRQDAQAMANALFGAGSISTNPPATLGMTPKSTIAPTKPSGSWITPNDLSPVPMQDQKPPLSGGFMPQSSNTSLTDAVAKLESNNSPNEGPVGRYVNYRYQQFPAFAKQYGSGAEGVNNYARQVLAANPSATFGDMYGGYVTGTGNPATAQMASLQTTTQPGAQGAYSNLVRNSPIPPNTPLSQALGSPSASGMFNPQPTSVAAPLQVAGDNMINPVQQPPIGRFAPSILPPTQNLQVRPTQPQMPFQTPSHASISTSPNMVQMYSQEADRLHQLGVRALASGNPEVALAIGKQYLAARQKVLQALGSQRYQMMQQADGSILAVNTQNPNQTIVVPPPPGQAQRNIQYEANKAGAIERAQKNFVPMTDTQGNVIGYRNTVTGMPVANPAYKAIQDQKKIAQQKRQEVQTADLVSRDIDRAMGLANKWTTGWLGAGLQSFPSTEAHNLQQILNGIKSNVGFAYLQQMRNSSPTGGALGQVSDVEEKLLQSHAGSIEQSQTKDQLMFNLRRLHNEYQDAINGSPKELQDAVASGKITQAAANKALSNRYDLSGYAADGTRIPVQAIQLLKKQPNLSEQFDAKYGPGAAARIFGGK